jgi:hypothetical protein
MMEKIIDKDVVIFHNSGKKEAVKHGTFLNEKIDC